jgi:hypothetical protein
VIRVKGRVRTLLREERAGPARSLLSGAILAIWRETVKRTGFAIAFLVVVTGVILGALIMETVRGPQFRAADYADMGECIRNIPGEWVRGSLEYTSAETSCFYIHRPDRPSNP